MILSPQKIVKAYHRAGHRLFENDKKNFNINMGGIRTLDRASNLFNDFGFIIWNYHGWNGVFFEITTDPGLYYRENPLSVEGTGIMLPGQYKGLWKIGTHKGRPAFQQAAPVKLLRDFDKDKELDFFTRNDLKKFRAEDLDHNTVGYYDGSTLVAKVETGMFGINGHKANKTRKSTQVDRWSAGCQVWADPAEHNLAMSIAKHSAKSFGNSFTYTLFTEDELQ